MSEAENENRRRIDRLQHDFEKSEIRREADKEVRRAEMETLRSNLGESLAKNEATLEDGLSRNREAIARNEAAIESGLSRNREAIARNETAIESGLSRNREAIARNEAAIARSEVAIEKLRTTIEKQGKWQMGFMMTVAGVAVAVLGFWLQRGG